MPKHDEGDRAFIRVQHAIHDLVPLLVGDDLAVAGKASALGQVRFLPAGPLAAALVEATLPVRRVTMLTLIREIAPSFNLELISALTLVLAHDTSDEVKAIAEQVLGRYGTDRSSSARRECPRNPSGRGRRPMDRTRLRRLRPKRIAHGRTRDRRERVAP
jgi:hypothetical protein